MDKNKALDTGLLIIRVGLGATMIAHGWPKLMNPEIWPMIGANMGHIGISFFPGFWGFMAAFAEAVGGLFLLMGALTRVSAGMLAFTMLIATLTHLNKGDGFKGSSHALELMFVFVGLAFTGAGKFSVDARWCRK